MLKGSGDPCRITMEIHFFLVQDGKVLQSQSQLGTQAVSGRLQPIFWGDCRAWGQLLLEEHEASWQHGRRLRSAAATCVGEGCASFSHDFRGLVLINELEQAGELCTLTQILMPDVKARF